MKVSVVIPVFETGDELSGCVESVLAQSLDDYEVIFVDDGSSDGTERLLDELAAAHDRIRVIHLPASGGPGGPRNTGVEAAHGEYVYFLDDDDWLGEEALERMYAMAVRNDSDIVIGKMVGHGRSVPRAMFRENRDRAEVLGDVLLGILTPHKLFRRAFVEKHGLRFPEGPVRLEDHRFVLKAYFRADTISVLADYPCCHWMKRAGSYSRSLPDPAHYYGAVREVLDIVDEHVPPGPDRDRYYAHWYRGKILKRLGQPTFLDSPADYRHELYEEVRRLTVERIGAGVDEVLPMGMRVRSKLLRAGARDDLFRLLEAQRGVVLDTSLDGIRWDHDRLVLTFTAGFAYRDRKPFAFEGSRWVPPVPLSLPEDAFDVTGESGRLDLYFRRRSDAADHPLPITPRPVGGLRFQGEAVIDTDGDMELTPGVWDLYARLDAGGWIVERRLGGDVHLSARGHLEPYQTEKGNVSVRVLKEPVLSPLRRVLGMLRGARRGSATPPNK